MTLKTRGLLVDHLLERQYEESLISPFNSTVSNEALKDYIVAGITSAANNTAAYTTQKLAEVRRGFMERKHLSEVRREHVQRYFEQRNSMSSMLSSRLRSIVKDIKKPGNEHIEKTIDAGIESVFSVDNPSDFVAMVRHDSTQMAHDIGLLLSSVEKTTQKLEDIFNHVNVTLDSEFERSFVDRVKEIKPFALHNVFVGPHQYLGNHRVEAVRETHPNDLNVPNQEFVKAYRDTGGYEFKYVESRVSDKLGVKDRLTLSASDVQLLHDAAEQYLTPLKNIDHEFVDLHKRLLQLEVVAHLIRIGDHPKHREIGLRRYRENFLDLEYVLQPSIKAIEKIAEPMYSNMQKKAMILLHVCEKWLKA